MRHAQPCFSVVGGQLPVTCERCNICTVTGEGTSFRNIFIYHSCCVSLWHFYKLTYVLSNIVN